MATGSSALVALQAQPTATEDYQAWEVGQNSTYIPRNWPYPSFYYGPPRDYNLKWGNLTGRLHGSVQMEFNDNINISDRDPKEDFIFGPTFGIGFLWPISEKNVLQFDLSAAYRAYLNHPELSSVQVSPDSRLSYQMRVFKAQVVFHDQFAVQIDPLSRPEISGGEGLINYRRFNNALGWDVTWEPIRDLTLLGGYEWITDRTLNSEFRELDRDDHAFQLAAYRPVGSRITLGFAGSYILTLYDLPIQNDGETFSFGPRLLAKLGDFINADAGVSYTRTDYDQTGTIGDVDNFEGLTFFAGLRHIMNSRTTEYIRASKNVTPGFHSNFTDIPSLQYGITSQVAPAITLNATAAYENLTSSGFLSEDSDRYLAYLSATLRLASHWTAGIAYSFGMKDSRLPDRDYVQNRVILELTRLF